MTGAMRAASLDRERRLVLEDPKGLRTYFYPNLTPWEYDHISCLRKTGLETPPGDRGLDLASDQASRIVFAGEILNDPDRHCERASCDERFTLGRDWPDGRLFFNSGLLASIAAAEGYEGAPGHSRFVAAYSVLLTKTLGIRDAHALKCMERGALLHDIGKICVPASILNKVGPLTTIEREIIRDHPVLGYRMIEEFGFLLEAAEIVLCHHERFDGLGYPRGLAGEEIPPGARIFALADTLDAITSDRPYRRGKSFEEAFREIERSSGSQFDPRIVDGFMSVPRRTWEKAKAEVTVDVAKDLSTFKTENESAHTGLANDIGAVRIDTKAAVVNAEIAADRADVMYRVLVEGEALPAAKKKTARQRATIRAAEHE
jgi:putative nucleotidyltransferase with HDIG domain